MKKIHTNVANARMVAYKISFALSMWGNPGRSHINAAIVIRPLIKILIWHILKSWDQILRAFEDLKFAWKIVLKKLVSGWYSIIHFTYVCLLKRSNLSNMSTIFQCNFLPNPSPKDFHIMEFYCFKCVLWWGTNRFLGTFFYPFCTFPGTVPSVAHHCLIIHYTL